MRPRGQPHPIDSREVPKRGWVYRATPLKVKDDKTAAGSIAAMIKPNYGSGVEYRARREK